MGDDWCFTAVILSEQTLWKLNMDGSKIRLSLQE